MNWKTICGAALMLALQACTQMPTITPPSQTPEPLTPTPVAGVAPLVRVKPNDLLFVEFFGLT